MSALLYRGQVYAPHHDVAPRQCVELTYRREHYNTCRDAAARHAGVTLRYRGVPYTR